MLTIDQMIKAWNTFRNCRAYFFLFCIISLLVGCAILGFIAGRVSVESGAGLALMLY